MWLAGDIGGTKTVLALFTHEDGPRNPHEVEIFPSADFASLEDV
jgi:glucokinase